MIQRFVRSILPSVALFAFSSSLAGETIRERAENHFAATGWSVNTEIFASRERTPYPVPGGNETFAAMSVVGDDGLPALYPEIGDLGSLDYSGIDIALMDALEKAASQTKERKLDPSLCDPKRAYLAPVTSYRLAKLPTVTSVWYSRPAIDAIVGSDGSDGSDGAVGNARRTARSVLRLMCDAKGGPAPLRMTVTLSEYQGSWSIEEVSFDGKAYAALAQQD